MNEVNNRIGDSDSREECTEANGKITSPFYSNLKARRFSASSNGSERGRRTSVHFDFSSLQELSATAKADAEEEAEAKATTLKGNDKHTGSDKRINDNIHT